MEKEKQIEEMAELIDELDDDIITGHEILKNGMIADVITSRTAEEKAEALINAGYRKADEVRKETAREILTALVGHTMEDDGWTWTIGKADIQFIAEEYGVDVEK